MRIRWESRGTWVVLEDDGDTVIVSGVEPVTITAPVELRSADRGPNGGWQGWVQVQGRLTVDQTHARIDPL